MGNDLSFRNPVPDLNFVHYASSYGHFIGEIESWSQCHILLFGQKHVLRQLLSANISMVGPQRSILTFCGAKCL